jgi:hypothetical protein
VRLPLFHLRSCRGPTSATNAPQRDCAAASSRGTETSARLPTSQLSSLQEDRRGHLGDREEQQPGDRCGQNRRLPTQFEGRFDSHCHGDE